MATTYEYDPWNGVYQKIEDDPQTGGVIIKPIQEQAPLLDWTKKQRNMGLNDLGGARDKSDFKHYATVSIGAQHQMLKEGINFWKKEDEKRMLKWLERNAPKLKATNRKII